jgi:nitrogenase molybdenum-iron protein alpha/beta subunit
LKTTEFSQNPVSDLSSKNRNAKAMNAISREEFNARIETIETRMDARVEGVSARIDAYLLTQAERDKAQMERDKRYDLMWDGVQQIAEESKEAIKQASTVKAHYWATTAVHFLGMITVVVGAHFANQAAVLTTLQTTLAAIQVGKDIGAPRPASQQAPESAQ